MLKQLSIVAKALSRIQEKRLFSDDNGTNGETYRCYVWDSEIVKDKKFSKLEKERALAAFAGDAVAVERLEAEIAKLPAPTVNFVFKLVSPIGVVNGTKVFEHKGHIKPLVARGVEEFSMAQNVMEGKYYTMKETGEMATAANGEQTEVIDLTLTGCILDVAEAKYNENGKMWRPERVWATNVSFKSLQVVGRMLYKEKQAIERLRGVVSEAEYAELSQQ